MVDLSIAMLVYQRVTNEELWEIAHKMVERYRFNMI